jgi:hypothetical protein
VDLLFLPSGFKVGRERLHDWTQSLVVTRERDDNGSEVCICWVGTFALITTDGGGWWPDEGAALGVKPDGTTVTDGNWRERLGDLVEESEQSRPRWPLDLGLLLARMLAQRATLLLPAVDEAFEIGGSLEHLKNTIATAATDPNLLTEDGQVWVLALGLLWLSEEERRRP